jgi:hypothetical protein
LHIEAVVFEMAVGARDFVWHPTQELAAVSERDLPGLRLCSAACGCGDHACAEAYALEQRAPGEIGARHAGGRFIAAAHNKLIGNVIGGGIVAVL